MSTSLLYHAFGVRGYRLVSTRFEDGEVFFVVEQSRESLRCAECRSAHVHISDWCFRRWRTVPIGRRTAWIEMDVPKLHCQDCQARRRVAIKFAEPRRQYTRSFERHVQELLQFMTPQDVSLHLCISWHVANDIQKRRLQRAVGKPRLRHVQRIAIDEIYLGKRHRFITLVIDLDSGAVVFDRFHIVKLLNEKLTQLRRQLYHQADAMGRELLKGTRWLLLRNPENLDDAKNERERLQEALSLNEPLAIAYYLKEELREFWSQPNRQRATRFLHDWCARAQASGIRILQQFANTLRGHRSGLLAWFADPISTGPLEGTNNRIKLMQRRAYGYRDFELLTLRILSLHTARFELVG